MLNSKNKIGVIFDKDAGKGAHFYAETFHLSV